MMEKVLKNIQHPGKREMFKENGQIYDGYLQRVFDNYNESTTHENYFTDLFAKISARSVQNSKQFSKLKHLCYDLADLLLKTGKLVHKISDTYAGCLKATNEFYDKINLRIDPRVENEDRRLQSGLTEWGSQLISQRKFVIDNMASFFHFKKHEQLTVNSLIQSKVGLDELFSRKSTELEKRKLKLFGSKDIPSWKVNLEVMGASFNELLTSYEKAKPHILPDVESLGNQGHQRAGSCQRIPQQASAVRVHKLLPKHCSLHTQ
jgi:hypothetical protein